jgi:hypothetical protein
MTLAEVMDLLVKLEDEPDVRPILESRFRLKQAFDDIQSGGGEIHSAARDNQLDEKLTQPSSSPPSMPSLSSAPSSGLSPAPSTGPLNVTSRRLTCNKLAAVSLPTARVN